MLIKRRGILGSTKCLKKMQSEDTGKNSLCWEISKICTSRSMPLPAAVVQAWTGSIGQMWKISTYSTILYLAVTVNSVQSYGSILHASKSTEFQRESAWFCPECRKIRAKQRKSQSSYNNYSCLLDCMLIINYKSCMFVICSYYES